MTKYLEVSDDFEIPEGAKEYTPEDVTGLKNKGNELLSDIAKLKDKIKERDSAIEDLNKKIESGVKSDPKNEQIINDLTEKLGKVQSDLESSKQAMARQLVEGEANTIAASLTKDTGRASLLSEKIAARLQISDDGSKTVLNAKGEATVSSIEDLTVEMKTTYPFLVDGSQASGGGAQGGSGRAAEAGYSDTNIGKQASSLASAVPSIANLPKR